MNVRLITQLIQGYAGSLEIAVKTKEGKILKLNKDYVLSALNGEGEEDPQAHGTRPLFLLLEEGYEMSEEEKLFV